MLRKEKCITYLFLLLLLVLLRPMWEMVTLFLSLVTRCHRLMTTLIPWWPQVSFFLRHCDDSANSYDIFLQGAKKTVFACNSHEMRWEMIAAEKKSQLCLDTYFFQILVSFCNIWFLQWISENVSIFKTSTENRLFFRSGGGPAPNFFGVPEEGKCLPIKGSCSGDRPLRTKKNLRSRTLASTFFFSSVGQTEVCPISARQRFLTWFGSCW